jgi:type I restriction enzyme, S subunit
MAEFALKHLVALSDSGVWGDEDNEHGMSVLRSTNFRPDGRISYDNLSYRDVDSAKRVQKALEIGDILLEKSGGGPKQPVGRVCLYRGDKEPHAFGNFLARLRPNRELVEPDFLFFRLWHFHANGLTTSYQKQTSGIRNLELRRYLDLKIEVPPIPEQRRIIDTLSRADNIVRMRRDAEQKTTAVIPALFQAMFGQHVRASPVVLSLDDTIVPAGWRWARLTDVARLATGHTPSRRVRKYWEAGTIPWITLTDIRALDGKVAVNTTQAVTQQGIDNSSAVVLPTGTVCFSRTASVGFVTVMGREMCTSQDFVNWICGDELDPTYLMRALMQGRGYLRSLASGSTHKTVYFPTVKQFCVIVPPRPLQEEFARCVEQVLGIERRQSEASVYAAQTFDSLLASVFRDAA